MAKEELIEMNGVVAEVLPDSRYRIDCENGHKLIAYTSARCARTTSASSPATRSASNCRRTT